MSKAIKWAESNGAWVLTVDGTTRGTVVEAIRSPGCWIGNAIGEHSTTATSHKTVKAAQQWVEDELGVSKAIEWTKAPNGVWLLDVDEQHRGSIHESEQDLWVARSMVGCEIKTVAFKSLDAATEWVERHLGLAATAPKVRPTVAEASPWTPEHMNIAQSEGWLLMGEEDGERTIERDDENRVFGGDDEAIAHVEQLAQAGSMLHKLALSIHRGEPAPAAPQEPAEETEEERLERVFQEARKEGGIVGLCKAIEAGYAAGHCMYDSDMISLAETMSNCTSNIIALAEAGRAMLDGYAANGSADTTGMRALRNALKGF